MSSEQEGATSTSDSTVAVETPVATSTTTEKKTTNPSQRLSGFFSTVGKKQQTETTTEADIAQARIARATRGKVPTKAASTTEKPEDEVKAVAKPEPKKVTNAAKPAPRPSLFKTRYLIGMVTYLLAANFVGYFETNAFASSGIDRLLTSFTLFGGVVQIRTSTLAYLATLILLLIVLAYFDLIPRSFSALSGQIQPLSVVQAAQNKIRPAHLLKKHPTAHAPGCQRCRRRSLRRIPLQSAPLERKNDWPGM